MAFVATFFTLAKAARKESFNNLLPISDISTLSSTALANLSA
jgi:hypothetical protein